MNPSRLQTMETGEVDMMRNTRLEESLPANKGKQLSRGEL